MFFLNDNVLAKANALLCIAMFGVHLTVAHTLLGEILDFSHPRMKKRRIKISKY
jgi:hypothetical protein